MLLEVGMTVVLNRIHPNGQPHKKTPHTNKKKTREIQTKPQTYDKILRQSMTK